MMTTDPGWVVDASVALKWYLRDEDHVPEALSLLEAYSAGEAELMAPYYIRYEIANALDVARIQSRISADEVESGLDNFLRAGVHLASDSDELLRAAIDVSRRYVVAFYDGLYLALAELTGYQFVTADGRLYRRIQDRVPYARWIGDLRTAS